MESQIQERKGSLLATLAAKFELDPAKFLQVVKATVFDSRASEEELIAFLAICNKYGLDPLRKEIYAFRQGDKVVPIVGIDGWCSVVNREPDYDGCEFENEFDDQKRLVSTTCRIYRKDRAHPTVVTEYVAECKRNTPAWNNMTARMNRHRSFIQATRYAFGISGLMEKDEFEQMVETQVRVQPKKSVSSLSDLTAKLQEEKAAAAPASEAQIPPEPKIGHPEPSAAVSIPPRRRVKKPEAPVTAADALQNDAPMMDEGGQPIAPEPVQVAPAAKQPDAEKLLKDIMGFRSMLGEGMFGVLLKRPDISGDINARAYSLGADALLKLRQVCVEAVG